MAEILAYEPDLIFSSRIEAAAGKTKLRVAVTSSVEELLDQLKQTSPRAVFLNLDAAEGKLMALKQYTELTTFRFVGYYSHLNTGLVEEARRCGVVDVLSRRAFITKLESIIEDLT